MVRLSFRCTDHGKAWTDLFPSKSAAFQELANAAALTEEHGVKPCRGIVLEMTEVEPDDLTPAERAELAERNKGTD